MTEYHKIQTLFHRDPTTKNKKLLLGLWSMPEFDYLQGLLWEFTEKVDGTNIRVIIANGKLRFYGKTDESQIPAKLVERLEAHFLPLSDTLNAAFPNGAVFYGEGFGAGIQDGKLYSSEQSFVLFDVRVGNYWLRRPDIQDIAEAYGLAIVPVIGRGTLSDMVEHAANGFQSSWGAFQAEGIVARPIVELQTRGGERIITKLKHKDF